MKTFSLSETQEIKLVEWQEVIKKVFGEYGKYDYIFSPTGIGDCVKVYSHIAKTTIDLTEVENW